MSTYDRRAARMATFVYFTLNGFGVGLWVVHIPDIEASTRISHSTLGGLLLLLGGAAFIGMQVAGALADRIGQRRLVPVAGVLNGVALAAPGLADSWWHLGLALIIFGFSNGSLDVAMNSHAVVVERAYPRPIMAAFHAMWSVGGALAAALGATVLAAGIRPLTSLAWCGAVIALISMVTGRFLWDGRRRGGEPAAGAVGDHAAEQPPVVVPPRRLVWWLGGLAFALMLAEGVANDWAALHARDTFGVTGSTAAFAYGAFAVAMTVGRFGADRIAALLGATAIVRYGAALAALGLTIVSLSPAIPLALTGWALFGLGLAGGIPQLFTAAGNLDVRSSGVLMARVVGLGYVGLLSGPAVVGGLAHWVPLDVAFVVPIALCVLAATFSSVLSPARPTSADTGPVPVRPGSIT